MQDKLSFCDLAISLHRKSKSENILFALVLCECDVLSTIKCAQHGVLEIKVEYQGVAKNNWNFFKKTINFFF